MVSAAPPATAIGQLVTLLHAEGFAVCVIPTPTAATWIEPAALAEQTGHPVRHQYRRPDEPDSLPPAHAVVVVPATFNTVNKWAAGISDTFALGILNEAIGLNIPIMAVPYAKAALAAHPAFGHSLKTLAGCGVTLLPNEAIRTTLDQSGGEPIYDWTPVVGAVRTMDDEPRPAP